VLKFGKFTGINNVLPEHRLPNSALVTALNVDVGRSNELRGREGYSQLSIACFKNLWQADGFMLATEAANNLVAVSPLLAITTIYPGIGADRIWYTNLPDGRTTFSNGLIQGITNGAGFTSWGVPLPASVGTPADTPGSLHPGSYNYQLTHVRLSDGLESGPTYAQPVSITQGGFALSGLSLLAGHKTNIYITQHNGDATFYAGSTLTTSFTFIGSNDMLVLPCRTEWLQPPPVGKMSAFWRGRTLVAAGSVLYASRHGQWELFDLRRDFKQFDANITFIHPMLGGIFVGTENELAFLAGMEFDKLVYIRRIEGRAVKGSNVSVPAQMLMQNDQPSEQVGMMCIADGVIVAGYADGSTRRMSEGRYKTSVTEVSATFRMSGDVPQYLAIPQ